MPKKCYTALSLFIVFTAAPLIAGDEDTVEYIDVVSFQSSHDNSWKPNSIGINLSRYYVANLPSQYPQVLPGFGFRGRFLEDSKIEVLAKASIMGWAGVSMGPTLGKSGAGMSGSTWVGVQFIGGEATLYWDQGGFNPEIGFYFAWPIGEKRNGSYGIIMGDFPWI